MYSHLPPYILRLTPLLLVVVVVSVFFESTLSPTINNHVIPHLDKIAHFFTFGLIAWLLASSIHHLPSEKVNCAATTPRMGEVERRRMLKPREAPLGGVSHLTVALTSFALVTLLGLSNEYIQSFTPGRLASGYDLLADMAGAVVFLLIWKVMHMKSEAGRVRDIHHEEKHAAV